MEDTLLTVAQVAKHFDVHPETVKRWLRSGEMKGFVLSDRAGWRIRSSEVQRFIQKREEEARPAM